MSILNRLSFFSLFMLLLTGCDLSFDSLPTLNTTPIAQNSDALPTITPIAIATASAPVETPVPTIETLVAEPVQELPPAEEVVEGTVVAESPPAEVAESAETVEVVAETSQEAPPAIDGLLLRSPTEYTEVVAGTMLNVAGAVGGTEAGQLISVRLIRDWVEVVSEVSLIAQDGEWQVLLPAPAEIVGPLRLEARLIAPDQSVISEQNVGVRLIASTGTESYIIIDHISRKAVAGKGIYLNGRARNPAERYNVTLEMLYNNCEISAGTVDFEMYGNGNWNGYLTVPTIAEGSAVCVQAYMDSAEQDGLRMAQAPLIPLAQDDPEAVDVQIGEPRPGLVVQSPIRVFGVAFNPPFYGIYVAVRTTDGVLLREQTVQPNDFGYWEANLPVEVGGVISAEVVANIDNNGTIIESINPITIRP